MKKSVFLAVISGLLLSLPFFSGYLWALAWVGFVPVFLALENRSRPQSFFIFFICGIIFWTATGYWLIHVTLPGTIVAIVYLALYFGLFGLIIRPCTRGSSLFVLLTIPSVWVALEYARGHLFTGLPWALLGYSQYLNLALIQISDLTGVWGVSFLIVFINAAIVEMIWSKRTGRAGRLRSVAVISVLTLILVLSYGFYKIIGRRTTDDPSTQLGVNERRIKVSIIQGNIPQEYKWDPAKNEFIMGRYITLSAKAARQNPDMIVWPEAAFPVIPEEEPFFYKRAQDFASNSGIPLLLGAVTCKEGIYYNSALFIRGGQGRDLRYNKVHLVPFGEYVPLKNIFPFLERLAPIGDIAPGSELKVFDIYPENADQPVKFSVLICFEDVFADLSRAFVRRGAQFLVNITNDAWYKVSTAPYQHLQASVFRAVENRVPLVRSANTGISCFIAPTGGVSAVIKDQTGTELFIQGHKTREINVGGAGRSFYSLFGDWFVLLCVLISLISLVTAFAAAGAAAVPYAPRRR